MRYIKKQKEPQSLTDLRNTEGASYTGPQSDWQTQLLQEQYHLCAYCSGRISTDRKNGKPRIEIEHYESREVFPNKSLVWENMVGVCNGDSGKEPHCDKTKKGKVDGKIQLQILNPTDKNNSENLLTFSISGHIEPNTQNEQENTLVKDDLERILNLNDEKLVQFRRDAMDRAKEGLIKSKPIGKWNKKDFEKAISEWETPKNGKLQPYCQAAIWFLKKTMSKPIYSS